jgi:hypothetical protein
MRRLWCPESWCVSGLKAAAHRGPGIMCPFHPQPCDVSATLTDPRRDAKTLQTGTNHLHDGHLADASIQSGLKPFVHEFTQRRRSQPCKVTASSSRAVRVRFLAQRHLDTHLKPRIELATFRLQPALPPEIRRPELKQLNQTKRINYLPSIFICRHG